ncbi:hypothetical protein NUW58_g7350 [Xylaria curta]|uniref:Uncharacterized protein n=1 Tax=Xylaria curta TaxID=42375 RepID=A0ACC1NHS8_9PEZI|nr:hypothetical protein NUW58_g7350 [Xylaria curta]
MLLGLDWAAVLGRTWSWLRQGKQRSAEVFLSITTFLLCIVLLLWKENWLVGKGIKFLLVAVTCIAIARHLWRSDLVENPVTFGAINVDAHVAGLAVCLPLAAFLLATTAGALALTSESRMKKLTSLLQEKVPFHTRIDFTFDGPTFPLLVLVIVDIDNWLMQHRPSTTSGVQWLSFGIAYLTTIDTTWVASLVVPPSEEVLCIPIPPFKPRDEQAEQAKSSTLGDPEAMYSPKLACVNVSSLLRYTSLAWHAALCSLTLLLVFYCAIGAPYIEPGKRSWDLDIVIAWYNEPVDQVVGTVQLTLELPNIASRKVRTIVYNKGTLNETELRDGFPIQSGLAVRRLQNVGREGDTYLTHVLDSEQDWASHTLFIQAEPHEPVYLQARLEDYFVEKTGFLSLSHVRNFCASCDACNDHSGWTEEGTVLRDIFSRSNPSGTCQGLSLTYRGQFVVSSRRMKQANHELLRELRSRLVDDERFGFTLERSWGTLFQCPTISERCPTLCRGG